MLESERSGRDVFKQRAMIADEALNKLSDTRRGEHIQDWSVLEGYAKSVSDFISNLREDAEANMPHGIPMLYIAREFDVFIKKIHKVLEKSMLIKSYNIIDADS